MKNICIVVLLLLFGLPVHSAERTEFYNGVRALGMGGAGIAVVNDETALFVNPAGLGKLRDNFFTLADPELSLGADTQSIIGADITTPASPQNTLDALETKPLGTRLHQSAQVFPSAVFPNFGIGVYANYTTNAEIVDVNSNNTLEAADTFTYKYRNDVALVFGFNFRIWDGRIKLGFNTRMVNRNEVNREDLDPTSTNLTVAGLTKEGLGIASDIGLIFSAPVKLLPTLAIVYRDVGGTRYNVQNGFFNNSTERPDATSATLDAALAIFPIVGKKTRVAFTAEYKDVLNAITEGAEGSTQDSAKKIHAGLEVNVADALFIRAGMNQRYWTAGLEIAVANYQLQFASYGEEIGTATTNREDRRYVGKFAWRF